ncbi:MAG: hypothetical protein KatS3mg023_0001 [Armatimonadota bacterium]|nr:MAG: hypothetical protein KatS3mg023_0001 [Armatimonadota bacterium]
MTSFRHRASFVATANDAADLLRDSTGNRRFVTLHLEGIDWSYRELDVLQLWSQAVSLYKSGFDHTLSHEEAAWRDTANARVESVRNSVVADVLLEVMEEVMYTIEKEGLVGGGYSTLYYPTKEQDWSPYPSDKQSSQLGPLKAVIRDGMILWHARHLYDYIADCVREKPEAVASQVRRLIGRFASPDTKPHRAEGVQFKAFSLSLDQVKELVQYIAGGSPES